MIDCLYITRFSHVDVPPISLDDKERLRARQSVTSVLTMPMLLPLFPLLALVTALLSSASAFQQASCEFQGEGTGDVRGLLLLNEYDTPDGTEIE